MTQLSRTRLARLSARLEVEVERGRVSGLAALVARGEDVRIEVHGTLAFGGGEPMRRDTPFRIASVTKPIAAAAAMTLVEEGLVNLDEPVACWLPELAEPKVLRSLDSPVDDVVPANRPITVRDLLTFRLGHGAIMAPPGRYPIQAAQGAAGVASGPEQPTLSPDAYMRALGGLPLLHQPGERWLYDTGSDVLGVLMARATGRSLGELMAERVLQPLGMKDTGFHAPEPGRLPTLYGSDGGVFDLPEGVFARPPSFPSASGGLVSTLDDLFAFSRMMLAGGRSGRERLLSRAAVALMTRETTSPQSRRPSRPSATASGTRTAGGLGWR